MPKTKPIKKKPRVRKVLDANPKPNGGGTYKRRDMRAEEVGVERPFVTGGMTAKSWTI